jgi:hypothetical protein
MAEDNALPPLTAGSAKRRRSKRRRSMWDVLEQGLNPWVTAAEAGRILQGVDVRAVAKLAAAGLVRTRNLPGVRRGFNRFDLERLIAEAIHPAKVDEPPD